MTPIHPGDASFKNYPAAVMVGKAMTDINPGPSCTYNVDGVQQASADQFTFASCPRSLDEGISDSTTGKGSESSHCTPHSCDEHEEHEHDQHNAINDALKRGFPMSAGGGGHEIIALRFNRRSDGVNVELKSSGRHRGQSSNADVTCMARESQEPDHDGDLDAVEGSLSRPQVLIPHEKIQNVAGKSFPQKLSFEEDIFMYPTGMKEAPALTNSQETDWLKYNTYWPESDSPENSRMI